MVKFLVAVSSHFRAAIAYFA